ncbi:Uncharacterised protein [uncultured archaeon]|nr:Uncharacterised protein [uncultured archaeon]
MKSSDNIFGFKKRHFLVIILCFIYGGYGVVTFASQAYAAFWLPDAGVLARDANFIDANFNDANRLSNDANGFFLRGDRFEPRIIRDPFALVTSPNEISHLIGGIISLLAGVTLWGIVREKEIKSIKQQTASNLLLPDEKKIIDVLKSSHYESTQSRLAKETGLGKVQVHRTIKRLEAKGIIEKHDYGLTNKILLKKELFE